jgi:hypothetical protein
MSKSFRRHKKSLTQKSINRTRKLRASKLKKSRLRASELRIYKIKIPKLRGGNGEKITCSMCEKMVDIKDTLIPRECLLKHGKAAHRICEDCWWDKKTGFALESSSHKCPGCKKGLALTPVKKEPQIVVDLTED